MIFGEPAFSSKRGAVPQELVVKSIRERKFRILILLSFGTASAKWVGREPCDK